MVSIIITEKFFANNLENCPSNIKATILEFPTLRTGDLLKVYVLKGDKFLFDLRSSQNSGGFLIAEAANTSFLKLLQLFGVSTCQIRRHAGYKIDE
jgi:hypothetical protein